MVARGLFWVWVFCTLAAVAARAERITEFSPFLYDTGRPEVLVLEGAIDARTGLVFKRAMRRFPQIDRLELVSSGGSVYDALQLSYDVRAAGLTTIIPQGKACASACSYLFFAGAERRAEGRLGVHQIAIPGADPQTVQSILGDVFQLFEDFDVPAGVHSKMMTTPPDGMFWFAPAQMAALGLLAEPDGGGGATTTQAAQPPAQAAQPPAQAAQPPADPSQPVLTVKAAGGGDFRRIADAIEAAPEGARIEIYPGTYRGGVTVTKPLDIIGVGPRVDIVWQADDRDVVDWRAAKGTLSGLTIKHTGSNDDENLVAIAVWSGAPVIRDCDLTSSNGSAVYVSGAESKPVLAVNTIRDSHGSGVVFFDGSGGTLEGNDIFGNARNGIVIATGANPMVRDNTIHDGENTGIFVYENGRGTIEANDIYGNTLTGISIKTGADPMVRGNMIHDGKQSGIFVFENGRGTIEDNQIFGNAFSGIAIKAGSQPIVRNNTITRNQRYGVRIFDGGGGVIVGNDLRGNWGAGIFALKAGAFTARDNLTDDGTVAQ